MRTVAVMLPLILACASALADPQMLARDWGAPIPITAVTVVATGEAGHALVATLKQAGAEVQVIAPDDALDATGLKWKPEIATRTVVVLGGLHDNRAILPLYANYLSFGDAAYPGGEGFVVRTIARPLGEGTAAIALEASTPAGEAAVVARFAELVRQTKDGSFPSTLEAHAPSQNGFWMLTGRPEDAASELEYLLSGVDPGVGFFQYGDYGIEAWVRKWEWLQDAPGVNEADRLKLDQAVLRTCIESAPQWWRPRDGSVIGGRHQTMGTSSFTAAVQLLRRRGNPNDEARKLLDQWWGECIAYWANACSTFHDDLEGYPVYHCPEPTLDWALAMGFDGYVRDQLPLVMLRVYSVMDNLGYYAGTGTYEECRPGDVYKRLPWNWLAGVTDYFHPGRGYRWLRAKILDWGYNVWAVGRRIGTARDFASGRDDPSPPDLLGIVAVPLGPYRYKQLSHDAQDARQKKLRYIAAPMERCYEKLCFRDSFEPDGQYLAMEGYQTAYSDNLPPMDANAILRYTDLGHVWLHTNTEKAGDLPRSAVFCTDGFNDTPQPAGCELTAMHNGARVGLVASRFPDYVACDWTRSIVWRRGRYFVVLDVMRQNREGRFGLICSFRTPQKAGLEPRGEAQVMLAREGTAFMRIRNADAVRLGLEGGEEIEGAAIPTLLRETQLLDGKVGDVKAFRNLIFSADPEHPGDLEIRPLGRTAALVRGSIRGEDQIALVAASAGGDRLKVGPAETDAAVLYLGTGGWARAGGTTLTVSGKRLEGDEGVATPEMLAALRQLWDKTAPASRPKAGRDGSGKARRQWRFDGFAQLPAAARAPVLTCEPACTGNLPSLLDGIVTRWPTATWPAGKDVTLGLDLRESRKLARIDFQTTNFPDYNVIPDSSTYPAPRVVSAEFSDDSFQRDVRRQQLTFTSDVTYEGLHKGSVFPILRWTCREVGLRARYVRLVFDEGVWPGFGMCELSVRPVGPNSARVVGMIERDIDGDGRAETVAWTDQAELVALRADGSVALHKQLPGYITAVEAYDDLGLGGPRLLVTTREARLYCLRPDGAEVWRTDFLESAKLNGDIPTGYSIGLLKRPDGTPLIVVGCYNLASFVSVDGKVLHYERLPAAYQTMTLSHGFDFDGDGKQEIVSTEVWGVLSVLDADMKRRGGDYVPRGKGMLLDYYEPPTADQARAVLCTETGVGLFDLKATRFAWRHDVNPISGCVLADLDGDGKREIVLGKEDGFVLVYDAAGALKRAELVGEPVRAIAVVRTKAGRPIVAAALAGRVVGHDFVSGAKMVLAAGEYSRLLASERAGILLAAGQGAVVDALQAP